MIARSNQESRHLYETTAYSDVSREETVVAPQLLDWNSAVADVCQLPVAALIYLLLM